MGACEVMHLWGRDVGKQLHEASYLGSPWSPGTRKLAWMQQGRGWSVDGVRGVPRKHSCWCLQKQHTPGQPSLVQMGMLTKALFLVLEYSNWLVAAPHQAVERWDSLSASYPQPSSSYTDPQLGSPCQRLAERRWIREYHHPLQGDDCGCARLAVAWQRVPGESDDTGVAPPQVGRARGPRRSGARREEDHVVAVAERHELQAPKPYHRSQQERTFWASHLEKWRENDVGTQRPLPGTPTIGVRSRGGPKPTSESNVACP
jgi:hypothetical protein